MTSPFQPNFHHPSQPPGFVGHPATPPLNVEPISEKAARLERENARLQREVERRVTALTALADAERENAKLRETISSLRILAAKHGIHPEAIEAAANP